MFDPYFYFILLETHLTPIRILGLFDTVGSLGVPDTWISSGLNTVGIHPNWNSSYGYHDTSLPAPKRKSSLLE